MIILSKKKILLQCIFNIIILIILIVILVNSAIILKYLKDIMNDKVKLNNTNEEVENKKSLFYKIKYKDL